MIKIKELKRYVYFSYKFHLCSVDKIFVLGIVLNFLINSKPYFFKEEFLFKIKINSVIIKIITCKFNRHTYQMMGERRNFIKRMGKMIFIEILMVKMKQILCYNLFHILAYKGVINLMA